MGLMGEHARGLTDSQADRLPGSWAQRLRSQAHKVTGSWAHKLHRLTSSRANRLMGSDARGLQALQAHRRGA